MSSASVIGRVRRRLARLCACVPWCDDWLRRTVEALDGERFWYPKT